MKYVVGVLLVLSLFILACAAPGEDVRIGDAQAVNENAAIEGDNLDETPDDVQVTVDENVDMTITGEDFSEWCTPGAAYAVTTTDASVESVIEGVETYEGEEFCKARHTQTISQNGFDMTIDTTYYFSYEGKEVYAITNAGGQETVVHIIDGEVVE